MYGWGVFGCNIGYRYACNFVLVLKCALVCIPVMCICLYQLHKYVPVYGHIVCLSVYMHKFFIFAYVHTHCRSGFLYVCVH